MDNIAIALLLLALILAPKKALGRMNRTPMALFLALAHVMGHDITRRPARQSSHEARGGPRVRIIADDEVIDVAAPNWIGKAINRFRGAR